MWRGKFRLDLLPAESRYTGHATVARKEGGHSAAGVAFSWLDSLRSISGRQLRFLRGDTGVGSLFMARKCPRTEISSRHRLFFKATSVAVAQICLTEVREQPAPGSAAASSIRRGLNASTIEKQATPQALEKTSGNRLKAAQLLGMVTRTLRRS